MKTREMNIKCAFVTALKAGKTIKQRGQKLLNKKKRKNINSFFHSLSHQPKWIKLEIACYSELCKPFEVIKQVMNKNSDEKKKNKERNIKLCTTKISPRAQTSKNIVYCA